MPRPTVGRDVATGTTKNRNVKVQPELWAAAMRKAQGEGVTMSQLIRDFLSDYLAGKRMTEPVESNA